MKILALELSSSRRSVAAWDSALPHQAPSVAVCQPASDPRKTEAFALIRQALGLAGLKPEDVDCIAVGVGPGSYTGIRAAISIAQGWSAGRPVRLLPIPALEILSALAIRGGTRGRATFAFDAQRGEVYACHLQLGDGGSVQEDALRLMATDEIKARCRDGEPTFGPDLGMLVPEAIVLHPDAGQLAILAAARATSATAEQLEPVYLREAQFVKAV